MRLACATLYHTDWTTTTPLSSGCNPAARSSSTEAQRRSALPAELLSEATTQVSKRCVCAGPQSRQAMGIARMSGCAPATRPDGARVSRLKLLKPPGRQGATGLNTLLRLQGRRCGGRRGARAQHGRLQGAAARRDAGSGPAHWLDAQCAGRVGAVHRGPRQQGAQPSATTLSECLLQVQHHASMMGVPETCVVL